MATPDKNANTSRETSAVVDEVIKAPTIISPQRHRISHVGVAESDITCTIFLQPNFKDTAFQSKSPTPNIRSVMACRLLFDISRQAMYKFNHSIALGALSFNIFTSHSFASFVSYSSVQVDIIGSIVVLH